MEDIDLYKLLQYYAKRWLIIVLMALLGLAGAFAYNQVQTPMYRSDATMLLVNTNNVSPTQETVLLNNYVKLFSTRRVLEPVLKNGNYRMSYAELAGNVKATNDTNTELIRLSITNPSAPTSQKLVNDVVNSFRQRGRDQQLVIEAIIAKLNDPSSLVRYSRVLGALSGSLQTSASAKDINAFMRSQMDSLKPWSVKSISVTGSDDHQPTYSMGAGLPLYVMQPDQASLQAARDAISQTMQ